MDAIIQQARDDDIFEVASIHKQQFPTHFLGKYSVRLLAAYYEAFLDNSVFLVSKDKGKVNGFVVGGPASDLSSARRDFLTQNKVLYITETILRPNTYWGVFTRLKSVMRSMQQTNDSNSVADEHLILSIAVDKSYMGKGIAQELCRAFEESIKPDASGYGLYVRSDNKRAIKFYEKMGFNINKQVGNEFYLTRRI